MKIKMPPFIYYFRGLKLHKLLSIFMQEMYKSQTNLMTELFKQPSIKAECRWPSGKVRKREDCYKDCFFFCLVPVWLFARPLWNQMMSILVSLMYLGQMASFARTMQPETVVQTHDPRGRTCSIHDGEVRHNFWRLKIYTLCIFLGQETCHVFLQSKSV